MAKIHFIHPDGTEARFALGGDAFKIGRAPDNDIVLPDPRVSAHHFILKKSTSGEFIINDLGATNPTRVNGRAAPLQELKDGDTLLIGDTYARYESPPGSTATGPPSPGRPGRPATLEPPAVQGTGCFALVLAGLLLALGGSVWAAM